MKKTDLVLLGIGAIVLVAVTAAASAPPKPEAQATLAIYDVGKVYSLFPPNIAAGTLKIAGPGVSADPTQNGQWGMTWTSINPAAQVVGYIVKDSSGTPYQGQALPSFAQVSMSVAYHKAKNGIP